jgi:Short C-terminal domain
VLSRSPDVRSTPLGQSLATRDVRMTKRLWRELARALEGRSSAGRVDVALDGTMGDGYKAVWALTESDLLVLSEEEGASRAYALMEITGVVILSSTVLRALVGPTVLVLRTSASVGTFGRSLAARARVPIGGVEGLFTDAGYVPYAGAATYIPGEYLGGYDDLPAGRVVISFDDAGVHLATASEPWWRIAMLAWDEVRELAVEGYEETRHRVTVGRFMLLGPLAVAVPKDENASRAYITVVTASGDLVVRVDGAAPQELRVRLGEYLRRPAAASIAPRSDLPDQIARLGELHAAGVLTAEEFAAAKRKLLAT